MKNKWLRRVFITASVLCLISIGNIFAADYDITPPTVMVTGISYGTQIEQGGSVTLTLSCSDNLAMESLYMDASDVVLNGFSGTKKVALSGSRRIITISNINGTEGDKSVTILDGIAKDEAGNYSDAVVTRSFYLKAATVAKPQPSKPSPTVNTTTKIDKTLPVVKIGAAKPAAIYSGNAVTYTVTFSDNVSVNSVNLKASNIKLHGFTANISVTGTGTKTRRVNLKNIQGTVGVKKYITIASSVAVDRAGNRSRAISSSTFSILKNNTVVTKPEGSQIIIEDPSQKIIFAKCIDDLSLIGTVNNELNTFSAWLRSEKTETSYAQENNRVAEDEKMTYYVEYYNGNTETAKTVKLELTIPYKVSIEEMSEGGKVIKSEDKLTIVEWNLADVKTRAACRLYVKVKYLENKELKASEDISEVYYVSLKSIVDNNDSYSYLRQLFVDTTEGKTGTFKSYLTAIDTTNSIRPNDEVTRAEFVKMLADSGVVKVEIGSDGYKTYKDYEKIPSYARDAVSALSKVNILNTFPDGEFKPNNPILIEDAIEMIAKASTYVSENKLLVNKPVFLYTNSLIDSEKQMSPKKDFVMELIRQNVITKYEFAPDKYMLRREAVEIINSLMFRGPYLEKNIESVIKYKDLNNKASYYYNIVGATNSYTFSYNYKLWEEMIEVNN